MSAYDEYLAMLRDEAQTESEVRAAEQTPFGSLLDAVDAKYRGVAARTGGSPVKRYQRIAVGDRVRARDALDRWHDAMVVTVPHAWRDRTGSHATTTLGQFPKAWLRIGDSFDAVPWPTDDIEFVNASVGVPEEAE